MRRRTFLKNSAIAAGLDLLTAATRAAVAGPAWGVNAAVLKALWTTPPSPDEMLQDRARTLVLDRFHRVGSDDRPATPTDCCIAASDAALFVLFRCGESDMAFPYANLDAELWSGANWHSLAGLPSGAKSSWPPFPDEVDFLIQPDPDASVFYQFAATPQGGKFGCRRTMTPVAGLSPDEAAAAHDSIHTATVTSFEARIVKREQDWLAYFAIPWQSLGGKPKSRFGLLPMRTRWRDGECSSPVALDFNESMPVDLLIETHFAGSAAVADAATSLCRLPSGILRWQTPATPVYPDIETCRRIWRMQSSLATPTDPHNLPERLDLVQRWMDLMTLEGFTPLKTGWGLLTDDLTLAFLRQKMNLAFQKNDLPAACRLLDTWLAKFDALSRWWYADGSPANILGDQWTAISSADSLTVQGNVLRLACKAGTRPVALSLALPKSGGVRIYGDHQGYWNPVALAPLQAEQGPGGCVIKTATGTITVRRQPFSISFQDGAGKIAMTIEGTDLAFRFGPDGEILASDFRNRLAADEILYGFGEQYDRFGRTGSVLTLWGTDDSIGNGKGLANATYKPLPIFHSTRPYMAFSNSSYRLRADIGKTDPSRYRLTQHGPVFDWYFWIGPPEKSLHSYTALTGRPPVPPRWAFEPWIGRGGEAWADGRIKDSIAWINGELSEAVTEEESVIRRFAQLDIPHSAIYAEGPSALSTDLERFLAPRNIRRLGYFRPEIGPARQKELMPELKPEELPILHGATAQETERVSYTDFTNPHAKELCRRVLARAFDTGVAGSMVDFGDWVPPDARFHDGQSGAEMHNFYAYDYHRTIAELFRERRGDDFILYARAAAPGTQGLLGQFAGDHPANFDGLRHVVTGALNLCACGYSTWGSDIGGYFGHPQPSVYMRWVQFGAFSPLMRPHGITPREPWHFGEAAVANYKFLAWVRENLLDYTHNAAVLARDTGLPIMRAMAVAFPGAAQLASVADQYMFGPDLLVAPVVDEQLSRTISFPPGLWTSLWNGENLSGTRRISAPLDSIPVYLRAGAMLPVQLSEGLRLGESMSHGRIHALVVTPQPGGVSRWTLAPDARCLLVYGVTTAKAVTVNGKPAEWKADPALNRLILRLPSHKGTAQIELTV